MAKTYIVTILPIVLQTALDRPVRLGISRTGQESNPIGSNGSYCSDLAPNAPDFYQNRRNSGMLIPAGLMLHNPVQCSRLLPKLLNWRYANTVRSNVGPNSDPIQNPNPYHRPLSPTPLISSMVNPTTALVYALCRRNGPPLLATSPLPSCTTAIHHHQRPCHCRLSPPLSIAINDLAFALFHY